MNLANIIVFLLEEKEKIDGWKVLALGCGIGLAEANPKWGHLTGVDIWDYHKASVDEFIQHDVRTVKDIIPNKSYDLVLCLDIIEHLERMEGLKLIKDAEAIAKEVVVFYTPHEWDENSDAVTDKTAWSYGNPHLYHRSLWTTGDFEGYTICDVCFPPETKAAGFLAVKWL